VTVAPLTGVVTVGTDHHRFDRLVDWLERWDAGHPGTVAWIVQHGSTRPMTGAVNFAVKTPGELLALLRTADLVVTQGGPGSIRDSRAGGTIPIVVPRLASLREAVDDHQIAFAERLAREGLLLVARTEAEFHDTLDRVISDPSRLIAGDDTGDLSQTVHRFDSMVGQLLAQRPARARRRVRFQRDLTPPPADLR
jgi:UDP-N-acetylglucosamine transferase subunit ALG13